MDIVAGKYINIEFEDKSNLRCVVESMNLLIMHVTWNCTQYTQYVFIIGTKTHYYKYTFF